MISDNDIKRIKLLISDGKVSEAETELSNIASPDDRVYYLRGNVRRKLGDWQGALNNYLEAIELNPNSPAVEARKSLMDILEFFNKDMYNQ
jgi:Flp pilus assembly protein TadD